MITWRALLKDKTVISNNFTENKGKIEKIYITIKRYIYKDPSDETKELNFPRIRRRYKTVPIEFKRVDLKEYEYDVTHINDFLIQEARMYNIQTGGDNKVGIRLTLDKAIIYFDDLNNTVTTNEDG